MLSSPAGPSFHLPRPEERIHRFLSHRHADVPLGRDEGEVVLSPSGWTRSGRPRDHKHTAPCSRNGRHRALEPGGGACQGDGSISCPRRCDKAQRRPPNSWIRGSDPEEGAGRMRTGSQAAGLLLVPRGLRVRSRVRPRASTLNRPRGLSCQRGGFENSFRSGRFLRFRLAFLPCRS